MSEAAIVGYLAGLFGCYLAGVKFGAAAKFIKDLGRSA